MESLNTLVEKCVKYVHEIYFKDAIDHKFIYDLVFTTPTFVGSSYLHVVNRALLIYCEIAESEYRSFDGLSFINFLRLHHNELMYYLETWRDYKEDQRVTKIVNPYGETRPVVPDDQINLIFNFFDKEYGIKFNEKEKEKFRLSKDNTVKFRDYLIKYYQYERKTALRKLTDTSFDLREFNLETSIQTTYISVDLMNAYLTSVEERNKAIETQKFYDDFDKQSKIKDQELQYRKQVAEYLIGRIRYAIYHMCIQADVTPSGGRFSFNQYHLIDYTPLYRLEVLSVFTLTKVDIQAMKCLGIELKRQDIYDRLTDCAKLTFALDLSQIRDLKSEWQPSYKLSLDPEYEKSFAKYRCNFFDYLMSTVVGKVYASIPDESVCPLKPFKDKNTSHEKLIQWMIDTYAKKRTQSQLEFRLARISTIVPKTNADFVTWASNFAKSIYPDDPVVRLDFQSNLIEKWFDLNEVLEWNQNIPFRKRIKAKIALINCLTQRYLKG